MYRIHYSKELQELIEAFFEDQNICWLERQIILLVGYVCFAFGEYIFDRSFDFWLIGTLQFVMLYHLRNIFWMQKRYYKEHIFLLKSEEINCFRKFAIIKAHKDGLWLDREINILLHQFVRQFGKS